MPSLVTLPTEIIKIIIEQFDRCRDVFACMRLCRRLFLIARQYIFHNAQPLHRILYWAIQANQRETVRAVLGAGANVTTPMMVHHRKLALLRTEPPARFYAQWPRRPLSPHGPPPYTSRYSALHLAVREGQLGLLKVLLRHGHAIDVASCHFCCVPWRSETRLNLPWHDWFQYHLTPLHTALCFGQSEIAQFLIKSGASIHGVEFAYQNPLIPGGPVRTGATALHLACGCGDLPTAKFLIQEGYIKDIDAQDVRGYSPLWYAFVQGKWDCFEWLLSQGANINLCVPRLPTGGPLAPRNSISVDYYTSLLDYAIFGFRFNDARMLINAGIDVHITASRFRTPLHSCCSTPGTDPDRLAVIAQLLDSKLDINSRVSQNCTPLLTAVGFRDVQATQLLIQRGADLDLKRDDGTPALWLACAVSPDRKKSAKKSGIQLGLASPEIVRMLLEAGARIYELRPGGRNLLQRVCSSLPSPEKAAIVRLLVRHTKNFDAKVEFVRDLVYSCFVTGDDHSLEAMLERIVSPRLWRSKADILQLFRLTMGRPNIGCLKYLLSIDVENYILWEPTSTLNLLGHKPSGGACEDMILLLLRSGAHQDFRKQPCTYMLHLAATYGYTKVIRWLLNRGVEVGHRDAENQSALAYADDEDTVKLLLDRGANPWDGFEHTERNLKDTPVGRAIKTNNSWKLEVLLSRSGDAPPCAVYDMIECSIILGAADCTSILKGIYPEQMEYLLSQNAETYLLKLLVQFSSRQRDHPDEVFRGSLPNSVVDTMSLLLGHDGKHGGSSSDRPPIDLEARPLPSRIPLAYKSIIDVVQDILAVERVRLPDTSARLKAYRAFSRRVSIYWTATEPEIMIAPANIGSRTTSGSTSPTSPSPPPEVLGGGYFDNIIHHHHHVHHQRYNVTANSGLPGAGGGGSLETALLRAVRPPYPSSPLSYYHYPPGLPASGSSSSSRSAATAESGSDTASTSSDGDNSNDNTASDAGSAAVVDA